MSMAGPFSHNFKWYMHFEEISNVLADSPYTILLVLIGVELLLCLAVTLS